MIGRVTLLGTAIVVLAGAPAVGADPAPARNPEGNQFFQGNCAVCHRPDGLGQAGLAPPLTSYPGRYAVTPEGRRQLVLTVLYGMFGDVVVLEKHYNFKMPDFQRFEDASLAAVLNYVVFDLSGAGPGVPPLSEAEIAAERAANLAGDEVRRHRSAVVTELGL